MSTGNSTLAVGPVGSINRARCPAESRAEKRVQIAFAPVSSNDSCGILKKVSLATVWGRCLGLIPLDARVFDPEIGITSLAPIFSFFRCRETGTEKSNQLICYLFDVPDQFVLQALWITFLQRARRSLSGPAPQKTLQHRPARDETEQCSNASCW